MENKLPAGDVATGLVWAYFINYLAIALHYRTHPCEGFPGKKALLI